MPVFHITYSTKNTYSLHVYEAVLDFLVLPATTNDQEIIDVTLENFPDVKPYSSKNLFGFEILRFRLKNLTSDFEFTLKATVKREVINPFGFISLPLDEERSTLESESFGIDNYPYLKIGELTCLPEGFTCPALGKNEGLFDFANRINQFINQTLTYDNGITDPQRKLPQTLSEKRGVCQDYAHLMLAIMRRNNIPARYISGYLNQGNNALGAGAVHAWVQVLIPGIGWTGFDPTNNLMEDHHYLKIAHGVDINDCTTLKGVIRGGGANQTDYHVFVEEQNRKEANQ